MMMIMLTLKTVSHVAVVVIC